jgi:hypothetical protein
MRETRRLDRSNRSDAVEKTRQRQKLDPSLLDGTRLDPSRTPPEDRLKNHRASA